MKRILIIGASGFVGRHLTNKLLELNFPIRVLTRDPSNLQWKSNQLEIFQGDLNKKETLKNLTKEIDIIFYLAHALDQGQDYDQIEAEQAENIKELITSEQKIIYLSGIGENELSKHLASRQQVAKILSKSSGTLIELRASIILGAGSASFEMIRAIIERFPIILDATWSRAQCQPIALSDLIDILVHAINKNNKKSTYYDIGGPEILRYGDLLKRYADIVKKRRPVITIEDFPKDYLLKIIKVYLAEYASVGSHLLGSIEVPTIVKKSYPALAELATTAIDTAMRTAVRESQLKWHEIEINEFLSRAQQLKIKQEFAAMKLIDIFDINLPFSMLKTEQLLTGLLKLNQLNPFKKFSFANVQQAENKFSFESQFKKLVDFNTQIILSGNTHSTHLKVINQFRPNNFIEAASYITAAQTLKKLFSAL